VHSPYFTKDDVHEGLGMKITYDASADAAYISLVDQVGACGVDRTYLCDPMEVGGMINIDLDRAGRILGIEVLTARALLASDLLQAAEQIGT
jgi:uncharacterized protein YuzE